MFRIGEFSQIAQLPTSQLRYYDEIGLLKPAHIDPWTHYRYYTLTQLPRLHRILALKELGLTLEQVGRLLDEEISVEEMRGMLSLRKAQIEQQLQAEVQRLRSVEARLDHLEMDGKIEFADVVIKALPAQQLLGVRTRLPTMFAAFGLVSEMRDRLPAQLDGVQMGPITVVFHAGFFQEEDVEVTLGFVVDKPCEVALTLANGQTTQLHRLPAVAQMASIVRHGGPENNVHTHAAIGAWAETHGYRLAGPGREVVLTPPRDAYERAEMVTDIQLPIVAA